MKTIKIGNTKFDFQNMEELMFHSVGTLKGIIKYEKRKERITNIESDVLITKCPFNVKNTISLNIIFVASYCCTHCIHFKAKDSKKQVVYCTYPNN